MISMEVVKVKLWLITATMKVPLIKPTHLEDVIAKRGWRASRTKCKGEIAHQDQPLFGSTGTKYVSIEGSAVMQVVMELVGIRVHFLDVGNAVRIVKQSLPEASDEVVNL